MAPDTSLCLHLDPSFLFKSSDQWPAGQCDDIWVLSDCKNVTAGALLARTALLLDIDWSHWLSPQLWGHLDTGLYFLVLSLSTLIFSAGKINAFLQIFMVKYENFSILRKFSKIGMSIPLLYFIFLEKSFKISSANFTNSMSINI